MRSFPVKPALIFVIVFAFAMATLAQQPATGRKKVPRMTTDDVSQPAPETSGEESAKEDAAKAPATAKAGDKASADETAWRERVEKARERAKQMERDADESELRVTELRNMLARSGQTANDRNQTAAELDETGRQLLNLRAQAREAANDLEQLLEHGRQKNFREAEGPKAASEDGKPNEEFYRARHAKLLEEAETAGRQAQLYENRLRDLNQRILNNGGKNGGDNFYILQLQQERQEMQDKLEEARTARAKAQSDIETLMDEARRAGVQPGVFR
jgi:chromosome segregation ATPase